MSSEDCLTDEGKRKKDDIDDLFRKSKKTMRTPVKGDVPKDTILEQMKQMTLLLSNLVSDVKDIKGEQSVNKEETKLLQEEIKKLRTEQGEFKEEVKQLKDIHEKALQEIGNLRKELKESNERIERLEREKRVRNIVIQGLQIDTNNPNELKEGAKNFIEKELGVEIRIESAIKLAEKTCLIELNSKTDKMVIMNNKSKLRAQKNKIYINDDMTKEERKVQAIVRKIAKEERAKGRKVKISFQKLTMDGEIWYWNREKEKLEAARKKSKETKN